MERDWDELLVRADEPSTNVLWLFFVESEPEKMRRLRAFISSRLSGAGLDYICFSATFTRWRPRLLQGSPHQSASSCCSFTTQTARGEWPAKAAALPLFLTQHQLAHLLGKSVRTLERDRHKGCSVPFVKHGRKLLTAATMCLPISAPPSRVPARLRRHAPRGPAVRRRSYPRSGVRRDATARTALHLGRGRARVLSRPDQQTNVASGVQTLQAAARDDWRQVFLHRLGHRGIA